MGTATVRIERGEWEVARRAAALSWQLAYLQETRGQCARELANVEAAIARKQVALERAEERVRAATAARAGYRHSDNEMESGASGQSRSRLADIS